MKSSGQNRAAERRKRALKPPLSVSPWSSSRKHTSTPLFPAPSRGPPFLARAFSRPRQPQHAAFPGARRGLATPPVLHQSARNEHQASRRATEETISTRAMCSAPARTSGARSCRPSGTPAVGSPRPPQNRPSISTGHGPQPLGSASPRGRSRCRETESLRLSV